MREFDIPSGKLDIYASDHNINTATCTEEVVARTTMINSSKWLENMCANETRGKITTDSGTRFGFVFPVAPYASHDTMVMVFPKEIDEGLKVQEIYDFPENDQEMYWRIMLNGLVETQAMVDERNDGNYKTFAVQNSNSFLSNGNFRGARSIKLVHFRLLGLNSNQVDAGGEVERHLFEEWGVLRKTSRRLMHAVKNEMSEDVSNESDYLVRHVPPLGYSLVFKIPPSGDPTETAFIKKIQKVSLAHFEAYKKVTTSEKMQEIMEGTPVKFPQPSFRLFASIHDGVFEMTHSPIVTSHAGPIEAGGILLTRSKDAPLLISEEERVSTENELFRRVALSL